MSLNKKTGRIQCDSCRRFISYDDLQAGLAVHVLKTPDSEFTSEEYLSKCIACYSPLDYAIRIGYRFDEDVEERERLRQKKWQEEWHAKS